MTSLADIRALNRLAEERSRQDAKWGQQNHDNFIWQSILTEEVGEAAQAALQSHFAEDGPERTDADVDDEVMQTGAVAVAWLGAIERRAVAQPVRVYISGPIASDPDARAKFLAAQCDVNGWGGYVAVNPFDVAPLDHGSDPCGDGYHPGDSDAEHGHTSSACFMRTDLLALLACDAIYMLPGWHNSKGAAVELAVAKACGMVVTYAEATS